jgi:hypothetical protein
MAQIFITVPTKVTGAKKQSIHTIIHSWSTINTNIRGNIMFVEIIHRPVFTYRHCPVYSSKHNVSKIWFCLRNDVLKNKEDGVFR